MQNKHIDRHKETFRELEKNISPILVVNNNALKPYVESFQYYPENIYQQPLGILLGFFEIKEYSEDSAYIVNFLNSVLKKEYYINPKRPVTESLDSALHKVNLALSEVAKHGNVNWLGKLDGAVCILEKNNLHFSVAGDAKVLLCRKQIFTDISEGLAPETSEPHPLKTFLNVSSGRLENKDKLLITSNDIFQIINLQQLTKNAARFSQEQFVQFIRTALSNELEMASVIVIDAEQKKAATRKTVAVPEAQPLETEPINVFSEKTFAKTTNKKNSLTIEEALANPEPTLEDATYTDKKTGHIYIQGQSEELPPVSPWQENLIIFKEHAWDFLYETKRGLRRNFIATKKTLRLLKKSAALKIAELKKPAISEEDSQPEEDVIPEQIEQVKNAPEQHVEVMEIKEEPALQTPLEETIPATKSLPIEKAPVILSEIKPAPAKETFPTKAPLPQVAPPEQTQTIPVHHGHKFLHILDEEDLNIGQTTQHFAWPKLPKFVPDFSKIKFLFSRFNSKQKAYLALAIFAIVFVPLLANKFLASEKTAPTPEISKEPSLAEILAKDKNIQLTAQVSSLTTTADSRNILLFDNTPYFITSKNIATNSNGSDQTFSAPLENNENIVSSAFMSDLNMILLLTNQKRIISFTPVSQQFKNNNIQIPEGTNLQFIGTYLTYLYITDPTTNQVYRYPRAEGGFGEKTNWLKNSVPLGNISALTLDDSIYFVRDNKINKLFKGQVENVNFENSQTPITYSALFTTIDLDNLYVLDAKNARVIVYAKTGEIVKQYFNEAFQDATTLTVSEKTASAYVITKTGVVKLAL